MLSTTFRNQIISSDTKPSAVEIFAYLPKVQKGFHADNKHNSSFFWKILYATSNVFQYYGEIGLSFLLFFFFWVQRCLSVWMQMRWILIKFCSSFCEACRLIYIGFLDLHTFSEMVFVPSEYFWDYFCNDMFLTLLSHWGFSQ